MPPDPKPPLYEYLAAFYDKDSGTATPALIITARDDAGAVAMARLLRCANNDAPVHVMGRLGRDVQMLATGMPAPITPPAANPEVATAARAQLDEILKRR